MVPCGAGQVTAPIYVGSHEPTVLDDEQESDRPNLDTAEDALCALTAWLRAPGKSREFRVETNSLGLVCKLLESGQLQSTGRGRDAEDALVDVLENLS